MKKLHTRFQQKRRAKQKRKLEAILTRHKTINRCHYLEGQTLHSQKSGTGNDLQHELVVSLTTFGKRIHDAYLTIESIMQQSLKPDRIVLCISAEDFSEESLPEMLRLQQQRGLEFLFCEKDLGPYTKYHYTLQKYPDSLLITVDDDFLYPTDTIDQLHKAYIQNPGTIFCHRGHGMTRGEGGALNPYRHWDWSNTNFQISKMIFPTGVGGVLYFPGCFDPEISNVDAFLKLAPNADDVWLKAMSLKKGTPCGIVPGTRHFMTNFLTIEGSQETSLKRHNKHSPHGNDHKIKAVFDAYDLWDGLTS